MTRTAGGLECRASQFEWKLDKKGFGNGTLRPTEQNLDSVLRTVCGALLPERGGALLHAAAVAKNGVAHLFLGPSGAGKTTISRRLAQAPGVKVLSDELPLLSAGRSGFTAHSTPFWGEFRAPADNGRARLGKIHFLARPAGDNIRPVEFFPLSSPEAQVRFLRCLVAFERSPGTISRCWDLLSAALKAHPARELKWRLDTPAADLARRLWPNT